MSLAFLGPVLLLAAHAAPAEPADPATYKPAIYNKVETAFGYVEVDPEDVAAAVGEGEAAQSAAARIFSLGAVRFAIIEEGAEPAGWGETEAGLIIYTWTFPHGSRRFEPRPAIDTLRHEIAHDLFARYLVPTSTRDQYGTDAPDWLDEMAAVAFESARERESRRRDARKEGLLTLPTLLQMNHPEFGANVDRETGQTFASTIVSSDETIPFYATVSCFYDFLSEKTGHADIVAELASASARGENLKVWLLDRLGYSRQGEALERMNADFVRWFAEASAPAEPLKSQ